MNDVLILIPAFNEEATISDVVKQVSEYGQALVVNDGSEDKTAEKAKAAGALVVDLKQNQGYDGALNAGFEYAKTSDAKYVVTFDADGQHISNNLQLFKESMKKNTALIVGIRPKKQRITETLFAGYTKLKYGIDDPLCGMKAYRMDLYKKLGPFNTYNSIGTELMMRYLQSGEGHEQIKIELKDRQDSQPRFGSLIQSNLKILKALIKGAMA